MKKFALAVMIIGSFILFSLLSNHINALVLPQNSPSSALVSPTSNAPVTTGTSDPPSSSTSTPNALYKDGTYTGSVADAQWGNVQIQVVIQSGKIANITFLQYPNERERSVFINNYADPRLVSEAIQAQSATVDAITGATDSSEAFMQSLSDALTQAQA